MCGISVTIGKHSNVKDIVNQNNIISHRGPDDEGFVLFNDEGFKIYGGDDTPSNVWEETLEYAPNEHIKSANYKFYLGLAHRRLSILDLSAKGHMPMSFSENRYWITYNGEIYNYIEIKQDLLKRGYEFNTETDTEVILAAYIEWGSDCQNKFNGMWAIVIYDSLEKKLFVSRDRFGIKPLYYWLSPIGNLHFSSEIKQFTVIDGWLSKLNHQRAFDYLYYSLTDHTSETLFKDVFSVPPGTHSCFDIKNLDKGLSFIKWYRPEENIEKIDFEDACIKFNDLFKNAVLLNARADVKVGSALSGGLDSSSIVCEIANILKQKNKSDLQETFSSCSRNSLYDEKKWIDFVVNTNKIKSNIVYPNADDIFKDTDKIIWYLDEPYQSQSVFLGFNVFNLARKNNVKVLLNGQGADEYLSGYDEFNLFRKFTLVKDLKFFSLIKEIKRDNTISGIKFVTYMFNRVLPKKIQKILLRSKSSPMKLIIKKDILKHCNTNPLVNIQKSPNSIFNISHNQIYINPLQKYLRWEDRISMAHSIEARVPFLDHHLVEFTRKLPVNLLDSLNYSKKLLRDSLSSILPKEIQERSDKKGFITPEEDWFKNEYHEKFKELLKCNFDYSKGIFDESKILEYFENIKNEKVKFDYSYWRIISFCIWMKVYKVELE